MYVAGYMVTGFLVAGAYAFGRLRGRWGPYERTALAIPLMIACLAAPVQVLVGDWVARDVASTSRSSSRRSRGCTTTRRAPSTSSAGTRTARSPTGSRSPICSRCWPSTAGTRTVRGLDTVPAAQRPPVNVVRVAFQTMVSIGTMLALLGLVYLVVRIRRRRLPPRPGSTAPSCWPDRWPRWR